MDIELAIDMVHAPGVEKDKRNEDVDGALLGKPEAELEATDTNAVQLLDEEYAEPVRAGKPDDEAKEDEPQIRSPVRKSIFRVHPAPFQLDDRPQKKAASFEAASRPTLARGSWPPESPAKPYLKVSCNSWRVFFCC
jgi:hypothetical protein